MPSELRLIQIAPATGQLGFDYPCDVAALGDIKATLDAIAAAIGAPTVAVRRTDRRCGGSGSEISIVRQRPGATL